jgi:hypothetical protein
MTVNNPGVLVFVGPTLTRTEALEVCPIATIRPPAERGDILRAVLAGARIVALIDGYFEHRLAVQHKEVLWALGKGVHVFGASSMGALRAAELDTFGMVGVGRIYQDFARGVLESDDEVAIVHEPGPHYRKQSEALVDLRATIAHAHEKGIVSEPLAADWIRTAESVFYPDRRYEHLLELLPRAPRDRENLREFLANPDNRISQKKNDAIELLRHVAVETPNLINSLPLHPEYFPWTSAWEQLWSEVIKDAQALRHPPDP